LALVKKNKEDSKKTPAEIPKSDDRMTEKRVITLIENVIDKNNGNIKTMMYDTMDTMSKGLEQKLINVKEDKNNSPKPANSENNGNDSANNENNGEKNEIAGESEEELEVKKVAQTKIEATAEVKLLCDWFRAKYNRTDLTVNEFMNNAVVQFFSWQGVKVQVVVNPVKKEVENYAS